MPSLLTDPLTQIAFSIYENKGVFAVLLGSGVSRSAEIPTGWEMTLDLVRRVALADGVAAQTDWAKWYREAYKKEPNYSELLEELATTREERRSILESYLEPTQEDREEGRKTPTKAHKAIAALVQTGYIKVIITTNFDHLMENALRECGIEPTVISSEDALKGAEPLAHSKCYLLKIHGDYKDARILNTESELNTYPESYNQLLDRIFDEYGLIICGWSGEWDQALRAAILRTSSRRYPTYWTQRGESGASAKTLIEHRRAKEIPIENADQLFITLNEQVTTLQTTHRQYPENIDLLISTTKRYLPKPEYRIQLDDLITDIASKTFAQLNAVFLSPYLHVVTADEFQRRVAFYEACTEPLARMASVLGRWGDGSELNSLLEIIRTQYTHAESKRDGGRDGGIVWLGLRSYPSVLIFTAYGLGLLRAQRWSDLHNLFASSLPNTNTGNLKPLCETLFLTTWKGAQDLTGWLLLPDLTNHRTPLSDHLLRVMSLWKSSFVGVESNFELLFGRFEVLASLAYLERHDENYLSEQAINNQPNDILTSGRSGWHHDTFKALIRELENASHKEILLQSGFAKGRISFLNVFFQILYAHYDQMTR